MSSKKSFFSQLFSSNNPQKLVTPIKEEIIENIDNHKEYNTETSKDKDSFDTGIFLLKSFVALSGFALLLKFIYKQK